jgi:sRNA-binding carbon storage regulator CsrA
MTIVSRQVDESLMIGRRLAVTITDIDPTGVRLIARGQCVGGPTDGEEIDRPFELGVAGEVRLGDLITITIARVSATEPRVYLSINAPKQFEVFRKEVYDAMLRDKD